MDTSQPSKSLIINNSPIEFAVIGPKGKPNGILVRSDNLKIDVIGLAALGSENSNSYSNSSRDLLFGNLFFCPRKIWSVASVPLDQIDRNWDERKSEYRFYWVGLCSRLDKESVRKTFNRQITDLFFGIEQNDIEQVEWSIAPVVLVCSEIHIRLVKRQLRFITLLIMYAFIVVLSFIVVFLVHLGPQILLFKRP
ncbi:hypothetical protein SAMD00079811_38620 [Scytonema sp. HK-05]|uniref:hypothetical protein n=1 Tax=Scytonema sp. HK-05 TaxID=1137095 RepID=UPI0009375E79|nr:hypothetical protein [Scytonema sp. HK-05]OKH59279.1 hypothetical protein NIES2130_09280 [Scytonema sp. HK-05]BAY46254.1 hypothetical protein SAMD00079811_38620 [Scytonema sp. HK-05]